MAIRGQDDLPYRSPITERQSKPAVTRDEEQMDTLQLIHGIFADTIVGLYKEFNAFDVLSEGTTAAKRDKMMRQIAGNQIAYDILSPLLERMENAMTEANINFTKRNT